jgi:hypothetical protein
MKLIYRILILSVVFGHAVFAIQKPNIIYILADDMGIGDVEALNPEAKVKTPNLDRLVAQGMTFTDALSVNAHPYSKQALDSAKYPWQLDRDGRIYLNVDFAQMGVGGETSWGAIPHEEYMLMGNSYQFEYRVVPIINRNGLNHLLEDKLP